MRHFFAFGYLGEASGVFERCRADEQSFGRQGVASGTFTDCRGTTDCFGSAGVASGTFLRCTGLYGCFGSVGVPSGTFIDCVGGAFSFIGNSAAGDASSGLIQNCVMNGTNSGGPLMGRMENSYWKAGFATHYTARIYGSTIAGTLNMANTTAGVTMTRAQNILLEGSNVFGATSAAALNIEDADVN